MPIRQRVKDRAASFQGQKSGLPIESYGISAAEQLQNFHLFNGQLMKVNGNQIYQTMGGSGTISSLHRFKYLWIAQQQNQLFLEIPPDNSQDDPDGKGPIWGIEDGSGTFINFPIQSGNGTTAFTSSARAYSSSWRNQIFFVNGTDCIRLINQDRNVNLNYLGLDSPGSIANLTIIQGSGNVDEGDNWYLIALYDSLTNTESPCCGAYTSLYGQIELSPDGFLGPVPLYIKNDSATKTNSITYTTLKPYLLAQQALYPRATHFIVYRSQAQVASSTPGTNGQLEFVPFYQVPQTAANSTDIGNVHISISQFIIDGLNFVDNTVSTSLSQVSPPTNNSPPPTPARMKAGLTYAVSQGWTNDDWSLTDYTGFTHTRVWRDQLFGIGAISYGYDIIGEQAIAAGTEKVSGKVAAFRDVIHGSEVYQPDYFPYVWEIGVGDGQTATGLGILMDVALLAFKDKSTYYLSGSSPDNFVLRIMDSMRGSICPGVIQETPNGVITLDRGGFVLWNQIGHGTPISNDIQDIIQSITFANCANFYSCYNFLYRRYECSVTTGGNIFPNLTLEFNIDSGQWSTSSGQEGSCRIIDSKINGTLTELVGSPTNGRLLDYSFSTNTLNQGAAITAIWKSGNINFGDDQHKKRVKWLYIRAKSAANWSVNIDIIPDFDESRTWSYPGGYNSQKSLSTWYSSQIANDGTLIWDDGSGSVGGDWESANLVRVTAKIPIEGVGYNFQIRITNVDPIIANNNFAIESVSIEGVMLGK